MNRRFRIIWSKALGTWVVASELTTRRGKSGGDSGGCRSLIAGIGASAMALCCWSSPASAQAWNGTTSNDWTVGSNWSTGTAPTGAATVTINTNSPNPTVLGVSGPATATIGTLYLSGVPAATPNTFTSALTIQNGSSLSSGVSNIGYWDAGSSVTGSAIVTVTGLGSSWSASSLVLGTGSTNGLTGRAAPGTLNVANGATVSVGGTITFGQSGGSGTLNVTGGGTLTTGNATIQNLGADTVNTANISGAGSKWSVAGSVLVGYKGSGTTATTTLTVANGGALAATGNITLGGTTLSTAGAGTVTVTGSGSQLSTSGALNIGLWSKGSTLTVSDGAAATADTVMMTAAPTLAAFSKATLNLSSGGTLATRSLTAGAGTAQVNFDGATLRATASNTAFVSGFTGTELNIAAGGLTLDTGNFTDTVASPFSGVGALTKAGAGTLVMTGDSSYAGGTTISAGTLQLGDGGTSGSITGDVVNDGTLVFDRSDVSTLDGAISGSGSVNQIGTGTMVLTGNNTYAGGTTISAGTLQLGNGGTSGSIAGNVTNNGVLTFDRSDASTYGGQISGTGAVNQIGTGTTILTGDNTYSGGTTVSAGTLAIGDAAHPQATSGSGNISIASGAALGGYGQIAGSVQNSGTFAAANALPVFATGPTGTLQIGGSVTSNGTLQLAAANGTPGNVLQIAGDYSGNGRVVFNTVLNQGGAASQSDRLVVGGNASGSTAITVNRSGIGAQTVGDGIQLVKVSGTSAANAFRLAGPIQAGAYQYLLYQGGSTDANSWYLRSQLEAAAATSATSSSGLAAANASAVAAVAYRPAVAGYSVTPLLNADYGFTVLGRLRERVGDEGTGDAAQSAHRNGVWGRIGGQSLDANAASRFSADERTFFAQFGKDWTLNRDTNGGSTHAGATVTFGSTSASFNDNFRSITGQLSNATGTVETQAQSLGGYWTRYLPDGMYFDGVGQLTHYHNRYGDVFGDSASQNGFGAGVSGEVGKPFALGDSGAAIEPQVQLLYQYLHLNGFDDSISPVGANSTNGMRGRVGFRVFKANLSNDAKTSSLTPWLSADVLHDFFAPGQTNIGGAVLDNQLSRTWYELGAGLAGSFGKHSTLYANVRYARNIGGDYRRTVFGQAGYRYNW